MTPRLEPRHPRGDPPCIVVSPAPSGRSRSPASSASASPACGSSAPAPAGRSRPAAAQLDPGAHRRRSPCSPPSSLTEAFTTLGKQFEAAHPGDHGDVQLRGQLGARAADHPGRPGRRLRLGRAKNMDQVVTAGDADRPPSDFVKNIMEIAVPPSNPAKRHGRDRPGQAAASRSRCASRRCRAARRRRRSSRNAKITVTPVTLEPDVKSTLAKVELGRGRRRRRLRDRRPLAAGSKVKGVAIPADVNASTDYPIATLTHSAPTPRARRRSSPTCSRRPGRPC